MSDIRHYHGALYTPPDRRVRLGRYLAGFRAVWTVTDEHGRARTGTDEQGRAPRICSGFGGADLPDGPGGSGGSAQPQPPQFRRGEAGTFHGETGARG
jgi:hypothetical protein